MHPECSSTHYSLFTDRPLSALPTDGEGLLVETYVLAPRDAWTPGTTLDQLTQHYPSITIRSPRPISMTGAPKSEETP